MEKPIIKPEQGKRLKECLRYRNRTQKWLEENAHISQQTISSIINGKSRLTEQNALLFSRLLDVSLKYLLLESDYITPEEKANEKWVLYSEREQLYFRITELLGYKLITTVSDLESVETDSFFINQWIVEDEHGKTVTLHHKDKERSRIFFLYNTKNKELSPPILMDDFMKMLEDIDYHFQCNLERPFRKQQEMLEYMIPVRKRWKNNI